MRAVDTSRPRVDAAPAVSTMNLDEECLSLLGAAIRGDVCASCIGAGSF